MAYKKRISMGKYSAELSASYSALNNNVVLTEGARTWHITPNALDKWVLDWEENRFKVWSDYLLAEALFDSKIKLLGFVNKG